MSRLASYFRKPRRGRLTDSIMATDKGWELIQGQRQNSRVLITCKGLLDKIVEKEEELGVEEFKAITGYTSDDFMEIPITEDTVVSSEGADSILIAADTVESPEGADSIEV